MQSSYDLPLHQYFEVWDNINFHTITEGMERTKDHSASVCSHTPVYKAFVSHAIVIVNSAKARFSSMWRYSRVQCLRIKIISEGFV